MRELKTLAQYKTKGKVKVLRVETQDEEKLHKMMIFGLMPGVEIEILQINPVYVIRIDNTELAIDNEIARNIIVY